jgi:hypothetical protein
LRDLYYYQYMYRGTSPITKRLVLPGQWLRFPVAALEGTRHPTIYTLHYRGTSLIRDSEPLGPYRRTRTL